MAAIQFATNSLPFHLFQDYMNLTVTFLKYSNNYENQKDNFLIQYARKDDNYYAVQLIKALEIGPSGPLKSIFTDYWNYMCQFGIAENTEHYFGGLCMNGNELIEKYRNQDGSRNEFVYKLVMAYVEWKGYEMNQKSVVAA